MPQQEIEQLVLNELDKDPAKRLGVQSVQHRIAHREGIHLTRCGYPLILPFYCDHHLHSSRAAVSEVMHVHDREGFELREPTAKKVFRVPKVPIGIHERWAGDGHDKLYKIGFPIWGVVDDATGKWLGAWVVPSNRMNYIVAYLFLCLVEKFGGERLSASLVITGSMMLTFTGIPLQFSTDCGPETTQLYGLVNALRYVIHTLPGRSKFANAVAFS
jgi:hypothetical protein